MKDNKYILGFEGFYSIYKDGRIYSHKAKCFMKSQMGKQGYWYVKLRKNRTRFHCNIHRALAIAFIDNPENKPQVNHIDNNRKNYNLSNLEWSTVSHNQKHSYKTTNRKANKTGTGKFGALHSRSVKINQYTKEGDFMKSYCGYSEAQRKTGIVSQNIHHVCNGKRKTAGGFIWKLATPKELQEIDNG